MCTALETRKDLILLLPSFLLAQTAYIKNIPNMQNKYDPACWILGESAIRCIHNDCTIENSATSMQECCHFSTSPKCLTKPANCWRLLKQSFIISLLCNCNRQLLTSEECCEKWLLNNEQVFQVNKKLVGLPPQLELLAVSISFSRHDNMSKQCTHIQKVWAHTVSLRHGHT